MQNNLWWIGKCAQERLVAEFRADCRSRLEEPELKKLGERALASQCRL